MPFEALGEALGVGGWGRGVGGRGVGSGLVHRVGGLALVGDVGDVTVVVVGGEGDDLGAAVGKKDAVRSGGDLAVAGLVVSEVVAGVVVLDGVGEVEGHARLLIGGGSVGRGGVWAGGGAGHSHEGEHHEDLKRSTGSLEHQHLHHIEICLIRNTNIGAETFYTEK